MQRIFLDWCQTNNVNISRNDELFFMDVDSIIKPAFITKNGVYVDIVKAEEITEKYLSCCVRFSESYGTLMVLPFDVMEDLTTISPYDIFNKFKILL